MVGILVFPFWLFLLWWLTQYDIAIPRRVFFAVYRIVCPGASGVYIAWDGPLNLRVALLRLTRAAGQNGVIYAGVGTVVAAGIRIAERLVPPN